MVEENPNTNRADSSTLKATSRFLVVTTLSFGISIGMAFAYISGTYSSGIYGADVYNAGNSVAPTVSVTVPATSSTVSGNSVTVSANATDDVTVSGVQFKLNTTTFIGSSDTSSPYSVVWDSTAVAEGSHTIIAVAWDEAGNYATSSSVTITVDNITPARSSGSPSSALSAGVSNTTLSLTTDESALCRYSTSADTTYAGMSAFSSGTTTSHSTSISGLTNGTSYNFYIKCQDGQGNTNSTDYIISFSVSAASSVVGSPRSERPRTYPVAMTSMTTTETIYLAANYFNRDLLPGNVGQEVHSLQKFLIEKKYLEADANTGFYGNRTRSALRKYQTDNGIRATGILGPLTRQAINNSILKTSPQTSTNKPSSSESQIKNLFSWPTLNNGMVGQEVRKLQEFLSTLSYIYPEKKVTGFFGAQTKAAVQRFQLLYGVVLSAKDIGYGIVGPKTLKKINELKSGSNN